MHQGPQLFRTRDAEGLALLHRTQMLLSSGFYCSTCHLKFKCSFWGLIRLHFVAVCLSHLRGSDGVQVPSGRWGRHQQPLGASSRMETGVNRAASPITTRRRLQKRNKRFHAHEGGAGMT